MFKHLIKCEITEDDIYRERGRVTQLMNQQAAIIYDKNQLIVSADINVFTHKGFNNVIYTDQQPGKNLRLL